MQTFQLFRNALALLLTSSLVVNCGSPAMDDRQATKNAEASITTCLNRELAAGGADYATLSFVSDEGAYIFHIFDGEHYDGDFDPPIRKEIRIVAAEFTDDFFRGLKGNPPQGPSDYRTILERFGNPQYARLKTITRGAPIRFESESRAIMDDGYSQTTTYLLRSGRWIFSASLDQKSPDQIPVARISEALRILEGTREQCQIQLRKR